MLLGLNLGRLPVDNLQRRIHQDFQVATGDEDVDQGVEPVAGVIGAVAVLSIQPLLPYALAFAAGAMIYVVVEEVIPETQRDKFTDIATLGFIGGFTLMMVLDVVLG